MRGRSSEPHPRKVRANLLRKIREETTAIEKKKESIKERVTYQRLTQQPDVIPSPPPTDFHEKSLKTEK